MTNFRKHEDPDVRWLYSENKRMRRDNEQITRINRKLTQNIKYMQVEIKELMLQVKDLKEQIFKKTAKKKWFSWKKEEDDEKEEDDKRPKKPGAKKGHKGETRKVPDRVDEHQDVMLKACPECEGKEIRLMNRYEDHYQEDIVVPVRTEVTRYRHHYYYCKCCKKAVHGVGAGELPGSYVGPRAKALAGYMRYHMSVPYRKVQIMLEKVFNLKIDMSSCVGFDRQMRTRGQPVYEKLIEKIKSSSWINVDETGWKGKWLWSMGNDESVVYVIRAGRGQKDLKEMLGEKYGGVLISDLLGAYNKITSKKQRCLVHVVRLIKKWLVYFGDDKRTVKYLEQLKEVIKGIIKLSNSMGEKLPKNFSVRKADLVGRLKRLLKKEQRLEKAENFRKRMEGKIEEFIVCLDYAEVKADNNLAERNLRQSVIMRKITHGSRTEQGTKNHEVLMSLLQTAKLKNHNPFEYLQTLLTNPLIAEKAIS